MTSEEWWWSQVIVKNYLSKITSEEWSEVRLLSNIIAVYKIMHMLAFTFDTAAGCIIS